MSISFFFNDTATTEIYTLSLHDALPILFDAVSQASGIFPEIPISGTGIKVKYVMQTRSPEDIRGGELTEIWRLDRKSTRLNSSHSSISYAVFCLKKKKKKNNK